MSSEKHILDTSFSRRALLGAGTVSALSLVAGDTLADDSLLPYEDMLTPIPLYEGVTGIWPSDQMPPTESLPELVGALEQNRSTSRERLRAVIDALRLIVAYDNDLKPISAGTAFEIERSGIYLTAKHTLRLELDAQFPVNSRVGIINPKNGDVCIAKKFAVHQEADIAAVYASTGKAARSNSDMALAPEKPNQGDRAWMVGLWLGEESLYQVTKFGRVDHQMRFPETNLAANSHPSMYIEAEARMAIAGLKPFGGTSGSPIINNAAQIVGVESGAYPSTAKTYDNYRGATVTPIQYAASLITDGQVYA